MAIYVSVWFCVYAPLSATGLLSSAISYAEVDSLAVVYLDADPKGQLRVMDIVLTSKHQFLS